MGLLRVNRTAIVALLCMGWCALAPAAEGGRTSAPTLTRLVKLFSDLEISLSDKLQAGSAKDSQQMLTEDFELRTGAAPLRPTPRAEWLGQLLGKPQAAFVPEQMAVHDYGAIAVVSFLQSAPAFDKSAAARRIFVVDVWRRAQDGWKLAVRYASPAGDKQYPIPGAATPTTEIEKRE